MFPHERNIHTGICYLEQHLRQLSWFSLCYRGKKSLGRKFCLLTETFLLRTGVHRETKIKILRLRINLAKREGWQGLSMGWNLCIGGVKFRVFDSVPAQPMFRKRQCLEEVSLFDKTIAVFYLSFSSNLTACLEYRDPLALWSQWKQVCYWSGSLHRDSISKYSHDLPQLWIFLKGMMSCTGCKWATVWTFIRCFLGKWNCL